MLFEKITISGNKNLESSDIRKIDIDTVKPINIILAANGSGKSSLMRAITPLPQNKKSYREDARIEYIVKHKNKTFCVGADYSNKHVFFISDGTGNINDSGNTGNQEQLVNQLFEYDGNLDKLLRMSFKLSNMSKSEREEFITRFHPSNLNLIKKKHKLVAQHLRGIKTNIKHLVQRKIVLESKIIKDSEFEKSIYQINKLKDRIIEIGKLRYTIENRKRLYNDALDTLFRQFPNIANFKISKEYIERISTEVKLDFINNENTLKEFGYDQKVDLYEKTLNKNLSEVEMNLQKLINQSNNFSKFKNIDIDNILKDKKNRILAITDVIRDLKKKIGIQLPELSKEQVLEYFRIIDRIRYNLDNLSDCDIRIIEEVKLNKLKIKMNNLKAKCNYMRNELGQVKYRLNKLETEIKMTQDGSYPNNCFLPNCQLRTNIEFTLNKLTDEFTQLNIRSAELEVKNNKYTNVIQNLEELYAASNPYVIFINFFISLRNDNEVLGNFLFGNKSVIDTLRDDKLILFSRISSLIDLLEISDRICELDKEKQKLISEINGLELSDLPTDIVINSFINDIENSLVKTQDKYNQLNNEKVRLDKYKAFDIRYDKFKEHMIELGNKMDAFIEYRRLTIYVDILNIINDELKKELTEGENSLFVLEVCYKEQEKYRTILKDEILPQLKENEENVGKYELLEKALGSTGIPHKYLVSFLNGVIKNANGIIKATWNYDMKFSTINESESVNFMFERVVKGVVESDISLCSDSQKDIFDIAFSLGLILYRGYGQTYPIFMDECDKHFDESHKLQLVNLITDLVRNGSIKQIFLVNHHAVMNSGLFNSDIICLSSDYISIPEEVNANTVIEYKR